MPKFRIFALARHPSGYFISPREDGQSYFPVSAVMAEYEMRGDKRVSIQEFPILVDTKQISSDLGKHLGRRRLGRDAKLGRAHDAYPILEQSQPFVERIVDRDPPHTVLQLDPAGPRRRECSRGKLVGQRKK